MTATQVELLTPHTPNIRSGWRRVKFGDVVRNVNENVRDPLASGLERYVGLEHLDTDSLHIRRWGDVAEGTTFTRKFVTGQVLFGKRRAYQRKAAVAEFDGLCSGDILVFEPQGDALLPELLPFIVQSDGFFEYALGTSAGSLSPRTRWRDLSEYEFALPPLDEQRRMADILWAADATDDRWHTVLDELHQLKASMSLALFSANSSPARITTCEEACANITVGIVVTPAKYYVPSGVLTLRSLNVFPDRFVLDDVVYISEEAHLQHAKSQVNAGDVVIVRTGRPGNAAVVPDELHGCNCIDLIIARPGKDLRAGYLSRFLNSSAGIVQVTRAAAGTAQQHFNVGALKKTIIPLPAPEEQDSIVMKLDQVDRRIEQSNIQISRLANLKKSLVQQLLG